MPKCTICGARLAEGTAICPTCGANTARGITGGTASPRASAGTTTAPATSATITRSICPHCGAEIFGEHRFCDKCGRNLKEAPEEKQTTPVVQERHCPSCGSVVQENARFCPDCGARFETSPQPQSMTAEDAMEKAKEAYDAEDYQTLFRFTKYAADMGLADAQYVLAGLYEDGVGVAQDFQKAEEYYRLAEKQGNSDAQKSLDRLARKREWEDGNIQIPTDKEELLSLAFQAVKTNATNVMKTILGSGFDASKSFGGLWEFRLTPLGLAAIFDSADVASLLIQHGVPVKGMLAACGVYNNWDHSPLMLAVINNSLATAKVLLDAGADVNASNLNGWTALKIAGKRGFTDMQRLLMQYGAKSNSVGSVLKTTVMLGGLGAIDGNAAGDNFLREKW